jgi:transcriptional regulator with XRE-family HTH domain
MDKDLKKLGVAIRAARAAVGVGQSDFADAIGVSQSTVARLETFRGTFPSNALLCSIRFFKSLFQITRRDLWRLRRRTRRPDH